jgi:hypothetical protein
MVFEPAGVFIFFVFFLYFFWMRENIATDTNYVFINFFYLTWLLFLGFSKLLDVVLLLLAILDVMGSLLQIVGSMILMMLTVPINIINAIMEINPILLNFMAFSFLLFRLKKHAIEKKITIITAMDTNIDLLGNSAGEKEEIVYNIKNPPIIVAFKVTMLFESISKSI